MKINPTILQLLHVDRWTDIMQRKVFYPKDEGNKQVLQCCYLSTSYMASHLRRPCLECHITLRNFISFETVIISSFCFKHNKICVSLSFLSTEMTLAGFCVSRLILHSLFVLSDLLASSLFHRVDSLKIMNISER